jgi:hypothetical protein
MNTVLTDTQINAGSAFSDFFFNVLIGPIVDVVDNILYNDSPLNLTKMVDGVPIIKVKNVNVHYYDYYIVLRLNIGWNVTGFVEGLYP